MRELLLNWSLSIVLSASIYEDIDEKSLLQDKNLWIDDRTLFFFQIDSEREEKLPFFTRECTSTGFSLIVLFCVTWLLGTANAQRTIIGPR